LKMSRQRCLICARTATGKVGKVELCARHTEGVVWDKDYAYLRQSKRNGKWEGIWPTQRSIVRLLEQIGYRVDQEVMFTWGITQKGVMTPYDIVVPEMNLIIEYQGEQHYAYRKFLFKNRDQWRGYMVRQRYKKKLADDSEWSFVEISYKDKPLTHTKILELIEERVPELKGELL